MHDLFGSLHSIVRKKGRVLKRAGVGSVVSGG